MIKAAIFDLDGTLSDSIMSMKYSGDKTMAEFGYGPFSVQDYKYFVGDGAANLVKRALIKGGDTELTHFEAAYARYREIFQANCMYQVKPYEGIPKLLEELKKRGMIPVTEQDYERLYGASKLPGRRTVELMPIRGRAAQPQEMVRETGREVFSTEHEMSGKTEDRGMSQQEESSKVTEEELQALLQELLTV